MPRACYVTTSIPYVNAAPHIGHALEFVQADVFARYHRLVGDNTRLLTGTDENSLKNVQAAEREGVAVEDLVARYATTFQQLIDALDVSHDDFIRTSVDPRHQAGAERLWRACADRGDIYKRRYEGLYCVGCEQFYTEDELVDGKCPEHGVPPEPVSEENYFFRLSRYGDDLLRLIDSGELRIIPVSRRNEVRAFIARGLQDFSISRSRQRARGWGIAVPADPDQVMYVWYDALANYITALDYATDGDLYQRYWVDNSQRIHAIGKGIVRFHAVYWPAMLLSAGVPLPDTIFVHGYLTVDGQKISKSLGNAIDPLAIIERFGVDALRYWLLRAVPPTADADYTENKLLRLYTADLANDLGNLLNRSISMLHRYRGGVVPEPSAAAEHDDALRTVASGLAQAIGRSVGEDFDPQMALAAIWELVTGANGYVEASAPWNLARAERAGDADAKARLDTVLFHLAEVSRIVAVSLRPFLLQTADRIAGQLGVAFKPSWLAEMAWGRAMVGVSLGQPEPLFPKIAEPVAGAR